MKKRANTKPVPVPVEVLDAQQWPPNLAELLEQQTQKGKPSKARIRLSTPRHVEREIARVYRMVDAGLLPEEKGTRRVYILRQLSEQMKDATLLHDMNQLGQTLAALKLEAK